MDFAHDISAVNRQINEKFNGSLTLQPIDKLVYYILFFFKWDNEWQVRKVIYNISMI